MGKAVNILLIEAKKDLGELGRKIPDRIFQGKSQDLKFCLIPELEKWQ